jgi:rhamnose transport system ATP-binding protein
MTQGVANTSHPRLEVRGISKRFGGNAALTSVDWSVMRGEVHALLGENGAGKSTLVKIITGYQAADEGTVLLDGVEQRFANPQAARAKGVVAVYQDPKLFGHLDVAENIFMGAHPQGTLGLINRASMYEQARVVLERLESHLDPRSLVAGLSIGDIQFVEFARALVSNTDKLLILDEPTAALTPAETEKLFRVVRQFRDRGVSIVLISHRLEDLEGLVDTVTVLRDGERVATVAASSVKPSDVVRLMVGRTLEQLQGAAKQGAAPQRAVIAPLLKVEGLGRKGVFSDVSFELHPGEVVAMAGLVGAGRTEVAQSIFGIDPPDAGSVHVAGEPVQPRSPRQMTRLGLAYVPEDRDHEGLIPPVAIKKNLSLSILQRLSRWGVLKPDEERRTGAQLVKELSIKAASLDHPAASLSGGNRQKVVLGKWLATNPRILILDEPTHGIDVATKAQVHDIIHALAAKGVAILVISSDLPEVLRLGDRVLVMADGRLVKSLTRAEATEETIMMAATWRARRAA